MKPEPDSVEIRERYWKSLEELAGSPDPLAQREFPPDAEAPPSEATRRRFLELAGASLALAGLTACTRQPVEKIVPYVEPPENAIPGHPLYFATAVPVAGLGQGVLVESHLGRPTKVEGNPLHPASLGATSVHSQACLLDLYDPDRSKQIGYSGRWASWESFLGALDSALKPIRARQGAGLHILTEPVTSPVFGAQLLALLEALPQAQWRQYSPAGCHSAYTGAVMAFGRPVNAYYRLDEAKVVVALDADFLACGQGSTRYAHDFASRRTRGDRTDMNRLYAAESTMTPTGGKADHRLALRYREVELVARDLAAAAGAPGVTASGSGIHADWIASVARDLLAHRGDCVVIPGDQQSPAVHALAHAMNAVLGSAGKTVIYTDPLEVRPVDQVESLRALAGDMDAGRVELLIICAGNPVYDAPVDFDFASRLGKVKTAIHIGPYDDETSALCRWHLPESHFLEDWGDVRALDGSITILQPLIDPLYDSRSCTQILDAILNPPGRSTYDIVRAYWRAQSGVRDFEQWWRKAVHDGIIAGSALHPISPALKADWARSLPAPQPAVGMEISFRPDPYLYDGRFANNRWLLELPQPMTRLTWDNAVFLSPATASRLGLASQDMVELAYRGNSVEGSVWVLPGQADESATINLGWGRRRGVHAAEGAGFNAYALRKSDALWAGEGLAVRKLGKKYPLATTQVQQHMEGRNLVIAAPVARYLREPDFAQRISESPPKPLTLYPQWNYAGYAWGMSIDLTKCVNCNACVAACQAENNIPVVGKEQVLARRAMHWLRVDTYYKGDPGNPEAYYQPVPCMQCENAPCELVCPVQATLHSADGLNDMVYNRCVGTRYCSNNCPYKVRRFNFFNWANWLVDPIKLQQNPDVTVRSRGVMEKCTYCVQRIREADAQSRIEDRWIRDGEVQTACQQACPTGAIIFGDINNAANRVARLKALRLNYALLPELNTRPRTTYLAELRNPNPELAGRA
jgi:MoCo/4Fe-4S cofactor protein with predicted Tat translocation signal